MGAPVRPASTSNDLTAVGITTCLPSELTSSLRIGEFPCRLLRTKNHHFASSVSLIFSDSHSNIPSIPSFKTKAILGESFLGERILCGYGWS
jgi:hypothetical protein